MVLGQHHQNRSVLFISGSKMALNDYLKNEVSIALLAEAKIYLLKKQERRLLEWVKSLREELASVRRDFRLAHASVSQLPLEQQEEIYKIYDFEVGKENIVKILGDEDGKV